VSLSTAAGRMKIERLVRRYPYGLHNVSSPDRQPEYCGKSQHHDIYERHTSSESIVALSSVLPPFFHHTY
jgi:hypothetical protein